MRSNDEMNDDYGVQSLGDSMFEQGRSGHDIESSNAGSEQRELGFSKFGAEAGGLLGLTIVAEMGEDDDDESRQYDRLSRPRQSSQISSSSGTILAGQTSSRTVHLDLSQLDPGEFPAILSRSNTRSFRSESPSHMYQEHSPLERPTPETRSRLESYPYVSPDSSTVSLPTSSYISISSLSRGSSPFAGSTSSTPARESGDSPSSYPPDRPHPLRFGSRPSYPDRYDQPEQAPSHARTAQVQDTSLVLPTITLPGSIVRDRSRTPSPTWGSHSARAPRTRTRGPMDIILTGPRVGIDDFIRQLDEVEGVRLFRIENGGSQERDSGKKRGCAIAVVQMVTDPDEGVVDGSHAGLVEGGKNRLLARLHVIMDRGDRHLEQTLDTVQSVYRRLNRLLAQGPLESSEYEEDASCLIAGWIESCKSDQVLSSFAGPGSYPSWFDFVIVTGEKKVLLDRDYEALVHLMSVAPTVCWPEDLQDGLARHLPLPFFKIGNGFDCKYLSELYMRPLELIVPSFAAIAIRGCGSIPEPTPRCQANTNKIDSYFPPSAQLSPKSTVTQDVMLEALIGMLRSDQSDRRPDRQTLSRVNIRSVGVQHFLAWRHRLSRLDRSTETSHMSRAIERETEAKQALSSPSNIRPEATRFDRSNTAKPSEWEAGLSRRHAFRKRNETIQHRKRRSINSSRKDALAKRDLFWEPSSSSEDTPTISRHDIDSSSRRHPLRETIGKLIRRCGLGSSTSVPVPLQSPWTWLSMTCIGLAVGFGCAWFTKRWDGLSNLFVN